MLDGLSSLTEVVFEVLGPFFGVEPCREDVRGIVLEVQVEVDIGAVVGAAAAHTRTDLSGGTAGFGVLVVFVVDDQCLAGSGLGDGPAGGGEASDVQRAP